MKRRAWVARSLSKIVLPLGARMTLRRASSWLFFKRLDRSHSCATRKQLSVLSCSFSSPCLLFKFPGDSPRCPEVNLPSSFSARFHYWHYKLNKHLFPRTKREAPGRHPERSHRLQRQRRDRISPTTTRIISHAERREREHPPVKRHTSRKVGKHTSQKCRQQKGRDDERSRTRLVCFFRTKCTCSIFWAGESNKLN